MEAILVGVVVLACPLGLGLIMWFMGRAPRREMRGGAVVPLETLRDEHRRPGDERARRERPDDRLSRAPR